MSVIECYVCLKEMISSSFHRAAAISRREVCRRKPRKSKSLSSQEVPVQKGTSTDGNVQSSGRNHATMEGGGGKKGGNKKRRQGSLSRDRRSTISTSSHSSLSTCQIRKMKSNAHNASAKEVKKRDEKKSNSAKLISRFSKTNQTKRTFSFFP